MRSAGVVAVPKRGNPNIVELYAEGDDGDEEGADNMYQTPGYQFDRVINDNDSVKMEQPSIGGYPPATATATPIGAGITPATAVEDPGYLFFDSGTGRGLESFTFSTLRNALSRRAQEHVRPVVKFVADVAFRVGTSLDHMMTDPTIPLVNTSAKTVKSLLEESSLPQGVLVSLMALVLIDAIKANRQSVKQEDVEQGVAVVPGKSMSPPSTPLPPVYTIPSTLFKKEEEEAKEVESMIISELESHRSAMLNAPVPIGADFGLSGAPLIGAGAQTAILDEIIGLFKSRYGSAGEELPAIRGANADSSMAIIRPEVLAAIESAYEDIRGISGSHASFKLIHLMTSPGVCHSFAQMVAALLNATPGEIQYPHYTRNVRGNNAVTGARVSSGMWSQARSSVHYKEKRMWFQSVTYRESHRWKAARDSLPDLERRLEFVRGEVKRILRTVAQKADVIWSDIDPVSEYADTLRALSLKMTEKADAVKRMPTGRGDVQDAANLERVRQLDALIQQAAEAVNNVTRQNDRGVYVLGTDAVHFVGFIAPAVPPQGGYLLANLNRVDTDECGRVCKLIAASMERALKMTLTWSGVDGERKMFEEMLTACRQFVLSNDELGAVYQSREKARISAETISEDDKLELVYQRPDTPLTRPVKNYYAESSIYATI